MGNPTHIVAAAGYVFDKSDNILLVKTYNRGWDCTGGQVEIGENLEEGVLREIMEESGIRASVRCLVGVYSNVGSYLYNDGLTQVPTKVMFDFICEYIDGEPTPSSETSDVIWVPKADVMSYIKHPVIRLRFQNVLDFTGRVYYASYISKPQFRLLSSRFI